MFPRACPVGVRQSESMACYRLVLSVRQKRLHRNQGPDCVAECSAFPRPAAGQADLCGSWLFRCLKVVFRPRGKLWMCSAL